MNTETCRDESQLITYLAVVNQQLNSYLRARDTDDDRDEPVSPAQEHQLGSRLIDLGSELQTRAARDCVTDRTNRHAVRQRSHDVALRTAVPGAIYTS